MELQLCGKSVLFFLFLGGGMATFQVGWWLLFSDILWLS